MRQAGLKPKSHKSGVYWTRAVARTGRAKQQQQAVVNDDNDEAGATSIKIADIPPFILAMIILFSPLYFAYKLAAIIIKKFSGHKA